MNASCPFLYWVMDVFRNYQVIGTLYIMKTIDFDMNQKYYFSTYHAFILNIFLFLFVSPGYQMCPPCKIHGGIYI